MVSASGLSAKKLTPKKMKHRKGKNSDSTQGIVVFSGLASCSFFKAGVLSKAYSNT